VAGKLIQRGKVWYLRYTGADGRRTMKRLSTDRRVAEELARDIDREQDRLRAGWIDPEDVAYRDHGDRPIREHLADYLSSLSAKGDSQKHARNVGHRVGRVLDEARIRHISGLSLSRVQEAIRVIRERDGLNQGTTNNYISSIKGFSRWLCKDKRAREHRLAFLATSTPEVDRRRVRRALTPEEAARVIQVAENGPEVYRMTGPDRAALYLTAIGSGFRAMKELAPLTPEAFDLDGDPPTVTARAAYTKNKREAVQPIPGWLVDRLRPWLAGKAPGRPVFEGMTIHVAAMLRHDLVAAGVPYETSEGVVDFHALRTAYITNLVASGASVKTCQTLARHSTPSLTIGIYAKASLHDIKGAVEDLPDLTRPAPDSAPSLLAMTGTDGTHKHALAPILRRSGDAAMHPQALACAMTGSDDPELMEGTPLENKATDASVRFDARRDAECCESRLKGPEGPVTTLRGSAGTAERDASARAVIGHDRGPRSEPGRERTNGWHHLPAGVHGERGHGRCDGCGREFASVGTVHVPGQG
jgi:integrase